MIKEILREIHNYFYDVKHGCKEGNFWHYVGNGVYSYLAKKNVANLNNKS